MRAWSLVIALLFVCAAPCPVQAQDGSGDSAQTSRSEGKKRKKRRKRRRKSAKKKRTSKKRGRRAAENRRRAAAAAAQRGLGNTDSEVVSEGDEKVKVMRFSGLDISGQLKSPQLLYFLNRMRAQFDRPSLPHRSFLPELERSTKKEPL